ncbi:hypothetical protein HBB16_17430 [Pseudonocardia sp. MCCB 268]|nr:hypothetical protein [Pseudonocardia cytotoxica]
MVAARAANRLRRPAPGPRHDRRAGSHRAAPLADRFAERAAQLHRRQRDVPASCGASTAAPPEPAPRAGRPGTTPWTAGGRDERAQPPGPPGGERGVGGTLAAGLTRQIPHPHPRRVDDLDPLPGRVDDMQLVGRLTETVAAVTARRGPAGAVWLMAPGDTGDVRELLDQLCAWLAAIFLRYPDGASCLPECWPWRGRRPGATLAHARGAPPTRARVRPWAPAGGTGDHGSSGRRQPDPPLGRVLLAGAHQTKARVEPYAIEPRKVPGPTGSTRTITGWWASRRREPRPSRRAGRTGWAVVTAPPPRRPRPSAPRSGFQRTRRRPRRRRRHRTASTSRARRPRPGRDHVAVPALITDGLALRRVRRHSAASRRRGAANAWSIVVPRRGALRTGAGGATRRGHHRHNAARTAVRGGAWPAIAAAIVAHLLYLLATDGGADEERTVQPNRPVR